MKQTAMADKYPQLRSFDNSTMNNILKDFSSGVSEPIIQERYKLNMTQFHEIRSYHKEVTGPSAGGSAELASSKPRELNDYQATSGARRQGSNETCLCGSGRQYKNCCAKKKR
jgi:hypothetical protein